MTTPKPVFLTAVTQLDYNPWTGLFKWRASGQEAGCINTHGYRVIRLEGPLYYSHRLAYLMTYGDWPKQEIDHIDGDRSNNRISNLRQATSRQNKANNVRVNKSTGLRGATKHRNKFMATIKIKGKKTYLGLFDTAEEAHSAYIAAALKEYGEFAGRGRAT